MTFAIRQSSGTSPVSSDFRYIMRSKGAMSSASSFSTLGPMLSGPGDLSGFRSFSSFLMPLRVMSMSSSTVNELSSVGIL